MEWPIVVFIIELTDKSDISPSSLTFTYSDLLFSFVIVFFTLEFLLRLSICPNKVKFIRDPMNVIDICAIVPFYLSLLLEGLEDFEIIGKVSEIALILIFT